MLVEKSQEVSVREAAAHLMCSSAIHPEHVLCNEESVRRWHAAGLAVAAWTVDEPQDVRRCRDLGVDALITNRPGAVRSMLGR
jgi:glycerophosphoryl diester phosphodiesterase